MQSPDLIFNVCSVLYIQRYDRQVRTYLSRDPGW